MCRFLHVRVFSFLKWGDLRCLIAAHEHRVAVNCVDMSVVLDPTKRDQQIFRRDLLFNFIECIMCVALVVTADQSSLVICGCTLKIC
jgi:hypothetical protein